MSRLVVFPVAVGAFLALMSPLPGEEKKAAPIPIAGTWRQNTPTFGKSAWKLTQKADGTYQAEETGLGSTDGTATFKDGVLTIFFGTPGVHAYYEWTLKGNAGKGKMIWVKWPADFNPGGVEGMRDGKAVRIHDSTVIKARR